MAETIAMIVQIWLLHALMGGAPLLVGWKLRLPIRAWVLNGLLLVIPFVGWVVAYGIWPKAGMSSLVVGLMILTAVVFVAATVIVIVDAMRGPLWPRVLLVAIASGAVVPIQIMVPALPD